MAADDGLSHRKCQRTASEQPVHQGDTNRLHFLALWNGAQLPAELVVFHLRSRHEERHAHPAPRQQFNGVIALDVF